MRLQNPSSDSVLISGRESLANRLLANLEALENTGVHEASSRSAAASAFGARIDSATNDLEEGLINSAERERRKDLAFDLFRQELAAHRRPKKSSVLDTLSRFEAYALRLWRSQPFPSAVIVVLVLSIMMPTVVGASAVLAAMGLVVIGRIAAVLAVRVLFARTMALVDLIADPELQLQLRDLDLNEFGMVEKRSSILKGTADGEPL